LIFLMATYKFNSVLGTFGFNEHIKVMGKPGSLPPNEKVLGKILAHFSDPAYFKKFRDKNIELTKQQIKESTGSDIHIVQMINAIEELERLLNTLSKRIREWYSYFNPEFEKTVADNSKFLELISSKGINQLLSEIKCKNSMGSSIQKHDELVIKSLSRQIGDLYAEKINLETVLDKKMRDQCPNMHAVAGSLMKSCIVLNPCFFAYFCAGTRSVSGILRLICEFMVS